MVRVRVRVTVTVLVRVMITVAVRVRVKVAVRVRVRRISNGPIQGSNSRSGSGLALGLDDFGLVRFMIASGLGLGAALAPEIGFGCRWGHLIR